MQHKKNILFVLCLWSALLSAYALTGQSSYILTSPVAGDKGAAVEQMYTIKVGDIFDLQRHNYLESKKGGKNGGIKAKKIEHGGRVDLRVFAYDTKAPHNKGMLIYGCYVDSNKPKEYVERSWDEKTTIQGKKAKYDSKDIKKAIMNFYDACQIKWSCDKITGYCYQQEVCSDKKIIKNSENTIQVIIELEVNSAIVDSCFVPGIGKLSLRDIVKNFSLIDVKGHVTVGCHRGYWEGINAPENTINAIDDALERQYEVIELDLWLTQDNEVIVFHDMGLSKRTTLTGAVRDKYWSDIHQKTIKNRFDELINLDYDQNSGQDTKLRTLNYILQKIDDGKHKVWLNLDRSANDMETFKKVYQVVKGRGMLDRVFFKGRYDTTVDGYPSVANLKAAFQDIYPLESLGKIDQLIKRINFTPILFDNNGSYDNAYASTVKAYIDDWISAGFADGFELNFKAYPDGDGNGMYKAESPEKVFLLKKWPCLNDKNFVEYIHDHGYPVGIFASVPEVAGIPDYNTDGTRNQDKLVSGFVKERVPSTSNPDYKYEPFVKDQAEYDFRGDWHFYIPAGVDYVITDRPDALVEYLRAIGRHQ